MNYAQGAKGVGEIAADRKAARMLNAEARRRGWQRYIIFVDAERSSLDSGGNCRETDVAKKDLLVL